MTRRSRKHKMGGGDKLIDDRRWRRAAVEHRNVIELGRVWGRRSIGKGVSHSRTSSLTPAASSMSLPASATRSLLSTTSASTTLFNQLCQSLGLFCLEDLIILATWEDFKNSVSLLFGFSEHDLLVLQQLLHVLDVTSFGYGIGSELREELRV